MFEDAQPECSKECSERILRTECSISCWERAVFERTSAKKTSVMTSRLSPGCKSPKLKQSFLTKSLPSKRNGFSYFRSVSSANGLFLIYTAVILHRDILRHIPLEIVNEKGVTYAIEQQIREPPHITAIKILINDTV